MKKILTLFIALILVAGIVSLAKSADIDTNVDTGYATAYPKDRHIVQSTDGTIVVVYQRGTSGGLVAKKSTKASGGGAWYNLAGTVQTYTSIDTSQSIMRYSICIDVNDNIYVTYEKSNDIFFKKLPASPGTWTTWTVGAQKTVDATLDNAYPTITYQESNGRIWVAYGQDDGGSNAWLRARYSVSPFDTWTLTTVNTGGVSDWRYQAALVIRAGNPYIVYNNENTNDLEYSAWSGSWSGGTINALPAESYDFSVTLIANTVHVAWFYDGTLRHARSSTGVPPWTTIEISDSDPDGDDYSCSLTTDWDTSDTELWCYASIYYEDDEGDDWDLHRAIWGGGSWGGMSSVDGGSSSDALEHYPNTPFVSGSRIPVAWTEDDHFEPYYVEFDNSIVLDEIPPGAPTNVEATPPGWTSDNSFQVDWDNPADPSGIAGAYYKLDSVPTSNTNGTWRTDKPITNITVSGSGSHPIYIWVRDHAGNINYVDRDNDTLYLDITVPTQPGRPSTPTPTSDTTPTWTWNASEDTHSGLRLTDTYIIYWDTVEGGTANSAYTNTNSYTHTVELAEGTWHAKVRAYDAVDNPSIFSENGSVLIEPSSKTYEWDEGGAAGSWTDENNWDLNDGYPDDANDKVIINFGSESINTGAARTIGQLELGSSYSGTLTLGGNLTLDNSGEWDGSLTISAGTTLNLAGNNLSGASSFTNNGTLKLQGGETTNIPPNNGTGSTVEYTATSGSRPIKNWTYHHLKINGSGGTFTMGAGETLGGNLTIAAGIFNLNGYTVNVSSDFLKSGGTLYMHSASDELDIVGDFTVTGGAADITVSGADIYIGGNIDISGDNSFDPSSGSYHMDHAGNVNVSITGANNDLGYGSTDAYFYVNKTNSTDIVTLLTDMDSHFFLHQEGIFDVSGNNASFDGVYYGYSGSKLKMSSGTFRCGKNGFSGGTHSPWWVESGWTEDISGGTITVYGGKHGTEGTAYFANGSNFTLDTGGTFELVGTDDSSIYIAEEDDADFNFYNLTIGDGTNAKTVEMHASSYPLDVNANFTAKTNATFNTGGKAVDVAGNVDIDGIFTANGSTITVAGNWDSSGGTFNYNTSTVDLTGTGNLTTAVAPLYNLTCAAPGETTTLQSDIYILDTLTLGDATGTLTDGASSYTVLLYKSSGTPLINGGATVTLNGIGYLVANGTITVAGGNYGINVLLLQALTSNVTYNLGDNITVNGLFYPLANNGMTNVVCNTQDNDITAGALVFGSETANGSTTLNCETSTIDIGIGGLGVLPAGGSHTLNLSSATVTCAGDWQLLTGTGTITQIPGTSTVTFDSNDTGKTITSNSQSFASVVFDSENDTGEWTLQDNFTCKNLQLVDKKLTDTNQTVTVNGNIIIDDIGSQTLVSAGTGLWIQGANGNISNPYDWTNAFKVLQIADEVFSTRTGTVRTRKLILGTNATLGGGSSVVLTFPTVNDFIDMGSGSNITGGAVSIVPHWTPGTKTQKAISVSASVYIGWISSATIQMTGNWTTGGLTIFGAGSSTSETSAAVLDTNGNDLTVNNGSLTLGRDTGTGFYGKIIFSTGTHSITDNVVVANNANTHGYFDLGSADISIEGNCDFSRATVTPGTSTVTLNGSFVQAVTSNGESFYHLEIENSRPSGIGVLLQDAVDIDGGLIVTTGSLDLNIYDITISSDVYISGSGSLNCTSGEQITVGRNWSAASGATFTAASSTTTFNGNGSFNILSSGTTFYNLAFSNSVSTWTLTDALYSAGDFTLTNAGNVDSNDKNLTIAGDFTINGGKFTAGSSTITVAGDWDSSAGTFNRGTSTVDLTETGNLRTTGGWVYHFANLKVAAAGKTTTIQSSVGVTDTLTLGDATGTLTDGLSSFYVILWKNSGTPLSHGGATITIGRIVYRPSNGTVTVTGGNYGTLDYLELYPISDATFNLGGNVTVNGTFFLVASPAVTNAVCNTQDNGITATRLYFGDGSANGSTTLNLGSSIIDIGTSGLDMASNGGSHTFNLNTSTVTCEGNWELIHGSGSIDQNWGTSTVAFDNASSTSTLTGSTTFYVLISTTTGKNVKFTSDIVIGVTNHLNFENITLRSTSSGATWYLNLSGTQDVYNVDVKDSNADDGNTIIAGSSIDSGNNTNWLFDDSILTWDGSESTDWNTAANWNFNIVPLSTHTIIIPNVATNDPQLNSNVTISSITIQTGGQLSLNERDINVSNDVYISGSLLCSNTEQITIGGNWSANSGATVTAANSTTMFNGSGSFNILSSGTTFYNLAFSNSVSTWTLTDALYVENDFTQLNGVFDTNSSGNYPLTIGDDITISGGTFYARVSTITLTGSNSAGSANWDSSGGTFTYGTSTVDLKETGTVTVTPSWSRPFYNLTCAYPGKITTLTSDMGIRGILTVQGGTLTTNGSYRVYLHKTPSTPISIVNGSTISVYRLQFAYTQNVPAYSYDSILTVWNSGTITQLGNITCTSLWVHGDSFANRSPTWNTGGYTLTINGGLWVGGTSGSGGTHTFNANGSTITVSGNVTLNHADGNAYLNLSTSNMRVAGNWTITNGTVNPGTSTVTFYDTGDSILTGSTTFYVLISTTSTKTVKFTSDTETGVTGHLNFENITLESTSPGATWYLNLSGTQDVHHVNVRDSNADDGNTIYAGSSINSGNNTNWVFDDSILTWDGSESTDWNTAANWNFNIVPLSTHTIIIPNVATNDPQLNSNVTISSITIQTGGQLSLNERDISVSNDVYISGSLLCSNTEQITIGGNWSANSGATVTAANSTTMFNGSGSFNILSSGTTFYNLAFSNNVSTWTLTDALYSAGDFTLTNAGNVDSNDKNLTIAGDFTINGGKFTAGVSTITVAGDWDTSVSANAFTYDTSTVDLTGTGTVNIFGADWWTSFYFHNLKCAAAISTTTLLHPVGVKNTLTLGSGILSGEGYRMAVEAAGTPFVHGGAAITLSNFVYYPLSGPITVAGGDYGTCNIFFRTRDSDITYNFGGPITVNGDFYLTSKTGETNVVYNTQNHNLTANRIVFGVSYATGDFTINCGTSTIDIGTGGVDMTTDGGSPTLSLSSATVTCAGDWQLVDGTGSIDQDPGTSTVTFDTTSTATLTGSTTFYVLISTTSTKTVQVSSDTVIGVTNHLNFENITLESTSPGATWYLNLSGTQDVSNVDVRDSNASGSTDTIIAFTSTDSGNNTEWDFGPPEAITDLTGQCDSETGDVTLYWSTPGDDYDWQNTLVDDSKYRIDYSSYSIAWSTENYKVDIPTHSVAPHTEVSHTITGLTADTTWYFQIWTADEIPLWSGLSNGATVWVTVVGPKTYTWTGGGAEGDWDDADNWSGATGYPNAATDKAIINTGSESINTGAVLTIGELELGSSYSGILTLGGDLTLDDSEGWDGDLTIGAGTLDASGATEILGETLTVSSGTFSQGSANLTLSDGQATGTAVTVGADGTWSNTSTGNITLGAAVSNAGTITLDGDGVDPIIIASSDGATQRNWQGSGSFNITDVNVSSQTCTGGTPAKIYAVSSTDGGNNTNWVFLTGNARYWVGGAGNWSDDTNHWATSSGGSPGGGNKPGTNDTAIFDVNSGTETCTINEAVDIKGLLMKNTYSGTITQGANTVTIGADNAVFSGGTFTGGSATITMNGTMTISGTAFTSTSGTLQLESTYTVSSGSFVHNSGRIYFSAPSDVTITPGTDTYYRVDFDPTPGTTDHTISGTLYIAENLTVGGWGYVRGGTIKLNGAGDQTVNCSWGTDPFMVYSALVIDKASGGVTLGDSLRMRGAVTIDGLDSLNLAGHTLHIDDAPYTNNTTFTVSSTGTLALEGTSATITPGTVTYPNVTFECNGTKTISGTFYIAGNLYKYQYQPLTGGTIELNGTSNQTINANHLRTIGSAVVINNSGGVVSLINSETITMNNLTINADSIFDVNGKALSSSNFTNNGTLRLQGDESVSTPTNNSGSTVEYTATSGSRDIKNWTYQSLKINGADGTFILGTEETLGENLTVSTGTFDLNGSTLTIDGTMTIEAGAISQGSAGLTVSDGQATGTAVTVGADGTWSNTSTGNITLGAAVSNAGTITLDGDGADPIIIASSDGATQRNWQGSGSFNITDVNVSSQTCTGGTPAKIYAVSSTDGGNNTNWVFLTSVRYWVGGAGNWSDAANHWSATSGGAPGASKPGTSHTAIFDVNSGTETCTINEAVDIKGLLMKNTYSGTITQGANTITIGDDDAVFSGGTFTGGSANINITTDNSNMTISGTAFTSTSATLRIGEGYTFSSGSFVHNSGTVNFDDPTFTITVGTDSFYNVIFDSNYGDSTISGTLYVSGYLRCDRENNKISGNIELNGSGDQTITGLSSYGTHGSLKDANLTINKSGGSAILVTYMKFKSLTINEGSTFDAATNDKLLVIYGNFSNSGTFNAGYQLTVTGSTFTNSGTFNAGSGTVSLTSQTLTITPGTSIYNNVRFTAVYPQTTISGTLYVAGNLYSELYRTIEKIAGNIELTGSADQTITATHGSGIGGFDNTTMTINKSGGEAVLGSYIYITNLTINANNTFDCAGYNLTVPSTFTNNGTLQLQGDEAVSTPTNNPGSTVEYTATSGSRAIKNWTYQSLKINGADGTFTLGTGETLGENLTISTGTFDLNSLALSINGATTIEAGAMKTSTNTVTFGNGTGDDSVSITGGELHIESDDTSTDIVLNLGSGSWSNTGGTIIYDGSTVNTDLLSSLSPYNNLTIDSAGSTYTLDIGDITVNGDLTINDGTLDTDANNYAISVGGDWNRAGGTFTVNNSTVTFITASSTSTLTGSTTFYGLVSTASGKNVRVSSDTVIGVTGHLNFENITLRSTLDNATWYLNLSGTQDVSGVDVRDSNASDGDTIVALNSTDSGNNTNWDFGPPAAITDLTGQCDSDTGDVTLSWSTPGDDEWTGVLSSTSEYRIDYSTDSSRQWDKDTYEVSIPTYGVTPHTEVSRTITGLQEDTTWYFQIWTADEIPNWSGLSNGATVWVTVIGTNTYTWTDNAANGTWTDQTNWDIGDGSPGNDGYPNDAEDKAVINTSTRTINTPASALTIGELELGGSYSGTLTLGNNLTLDDSEGWNGNLTIGAGTLDVSGSNHQINIDGNWSNSGTFTAQSGTVTFYATASKTLSGTMTGTSAFYNLYFDSASGTWTLSNDLKVTNVLNINAGELDASSRTIELAGSGTPFLISDTFTPSASTVQYTSPNDTNITAANYYHLDLIDPPLETRNQKPVTSDQKELLQNLEKLKIKEIEPDKFTFKSLSGDLIEIGEERHSPPQPYLKLNRWDGEVSLKVDIPYAIDGQKSLVNNRLRWVNHRYDVDFYPKSPQEIIETIQGKDYIFRINQEGGVEFDVTLKEKPESNVFTFPIEAQGLKFYYQPPLHPEHPTWADVDGDGKPDSFRPENVVGSYAVYHETQDKFFKTKEEAEKYKCGKAFHIYRPKVYDAEGKETWGKLNINEQAGILTVTIDQDWLDNAVYPVVIDPNFGYETEGTSGTKGSTNYIWGSLFTSDNVAGTVDSITAYSYGTSGYTYRFVVYKVSDKSRIDYTAAIDAQETVDWRTSDGTQNGEILASTDYYLGMWMQNFSSKMYYDTVTDAGFSIVVTYSPTNPPPATLGTLTTRNYRFSIYCTYTPEAGATYTLLPGTFDIDGNLTIGNSTDTMEVTADTNDPTIDLEGNFNITANSTFTASDTASFNVGGNWSNSGTFTHSTGTITLDGSSGTQTVTSDGQSFYNLTINNTGTSVQLEDDLDVNGNLTISAGTLDTKSGENNPIYVAGNWTREGGAFECRQSTVTFDNASSTSTLTGSTTFYVLVSTATGKNVKVSSDTVIGVTNHLNFENITLRSTSNGATWYLNLSGSGTQDVSGVDVRDSNASGGETIVDFDCPDIESCYYGNNTKWDFGPPAAITDLTGLCDSDTGDVTLSWSTPGDDDWLGTLPSGSEYRIDYSTDSTKQWDKDDYEVPISTSGVAPNTEVSHTITGLTGDTTWYFQIWTADEIPRWSGLSNGATVWVNPILSVSISTNTYDFGDVPLGQSTHTVSVITVTNEGNVNETYSLKISSVTLYDNSPSLWKSTNTTTGHNRFIFYAIFHAVQVSTSNFDSDDYVIDENRASTADWFSDNDGGGDKQTGINVPKGDDRKLWFRLDMPTSTTTGKEEKITVTITAGPE